MSIGKGIVMFKTVMKRRIVTRMMALWVIMGNYRNHDSYVGDDFGTDNVYNVEC